MGKRLRVFGGSSNPELTKEICSFLGIPVGAVELKKFADGEIGVKYEDFVRGCDVYIIQSTSTPVNDHLMELMLMIDAAKRASAKRITAVISYFGYARQDRKTVPRVPISAALVASLLTASGVDRILVIDLHCGQIQGFFDNKVGFDNLSAQPILAAAAKEIIDGIKLENLCIVSPDAGGVERTDVFRKEMMKIFQHKYKKDQEMNMKMAVMNKKRVEANKVAKMELVGDVTDCDCIIVDDMIDTAGTLCTAAETLKKGGAKRIFAVASHGLFNSPALEKIESSPLEKVIVTNTIALKKENLEASTKIHQISIAELLGEAIRRLYNNEPLSLLFTNVNHNSY